MLKKILLVLGVIVFYSNTYSQLPPVFDKAYANTVETSTLARKYLSPVRIVWKTPDAEKNIVNAEWLLKPGTGQADLVGGNLCKLKSEGSLRPSILLDFGKEIHGGIQIVTGMSKSGKPVTIRLRFGESVTEAMSTVGDTTNATNDHAIRDEMVQVPWLGKLETGNTGFRFLRIDLVDKDAELLLKEVRAIFIYRDIPYLGSFHSSDSLLDKIWMTGAYTVHLNMQEYLWDGIKRDRLVWIGDAHPETSTIAAVFGNNEVVPKTLDFARDITKLPEYMNGMISYSMWWVIIQRDYYLHNGDLKYLKEQHAYLKGLLEHYMQKIDSNNREKLDDGTRFLDWPSSENQKGVDAGLHAMLIMTLDAGAELCAILKDNATANKCKDAAKRLRKYVPDVNSSKQAAALLALSGLVSAEKANREIIAVDSVKNFSTFFGYYMLQAMAKANDYDGAINAIRNYWGPMLQLGASTFWEDFNIDWLPNAARIDELPKPGQTDIHSSYGAYCYKGFRHSLAHGWASGPTPWLTEHVLGIKPIAAGCKVIEVKPHLGDLSFAEGTFPTPYGIVKVRHTKLANGKIKSEISAPKEVRIVR
jgi:alpha-L-rhamnosidase